MTLLTCAFSFTATAVLFCLLVIATTAELRMASFTAFKCKVSDNAYAGEWQCNTKTNNRNKTVINLSLDIIRQIDDVVVRLKLFKKFKSFMPFLLDFKENFCHLLAKKSMIYTRIYVLYDLIQKYTNMNHTCPYMGLVEIKALEFDSRKVRDAVPPGEYRLICTIFVNKKKSPSLETQTDFLIG